MLARIKENFERAARNGWFEPGGPGDILELPANPRAGAVGYREAAVLCLIALHHDMPHLLITKRSHNIAFSGHACLPGGSRESDDTSLVETALREAAEETALDKKQVEVVCALPSVFTPHNGGTAVTPVVALLHGSPHQLNLTPNPFEVECLYWVPLESFLSHQVQTTTSTMPSLRSREERERVRWNRVTVIHKDPETGQTHKIWGLTGIMCVTISAIALNQRPAYHFVSGAVKDVVRTDNTLTVTFHPVALTRDQRQPISKL